MLAFDEHSAPPEASVVIPVYNEQETIRQVLEQVIHALEQMTELCEVVVINDGSSDKTAQILEEFKKQKKIRCHDSGHAKGGKGGALRTGFDLARGRCIVMMDGDGSHQADDIPKLVAEQKRTGGLVVASRIYGGSEEYTRIRAFGNILFTWLFGLFHGRYLSDALNGFKAFNIDIYRNFQYSSTGYEIEIELLVNTLKSKRLITEVPSLELRRQGGEVKSKIVKDGFRFLWRIIYEWLRIRKARKEA